MDETSRPRAQAASLADWVGTHQAERVQYNTWTFSCSTFIEDPSMLDSLRAWDGLDGHVATLYIGARRANRQSLKAANSTPVFRTLNIPISKR
ncbi:MAG: hypothetical protein Q9181_000751 [Wetmoreana brouardii]